MLSLSSLIYITIIVLTGSGLAGIVSWALGGVTATVKYNKCVREAWMTIDMLCHYRYDMAEQLCNEIYGVNGKGTDNTREMKDLIAQAIAAETDICKRIPIEQQIGKAVWRTMEEIYNDKAELCGNAIVMAKMKNLRSTDIELTRLYLTYNVGAEKLSAALKTIPGMITAKRGNYYDLQRLQTRFKY